MTQIEEQKSDVKLQYSCRKCRKVLFTEDNLEEHMSKVKSYNTKHNSVKVFINTTHHYFENRRRWVPNALQYLSRKWTGLNRTQMIKLERSHVPNAMKK